MNTQDPALWLNKFSIELTSASSHLYSNSRQQAELRLTAEVQPGQPALSPEQISSLSVVLEKDDGSFEQLPFDDSSKLWWQSTTRDTRYDLMPGTLTTTEAPTVPASASVNTRLVSKLLYVSTRQTGGSTATLRAQIRKDPSTIYYTTEADSFDCSVVLTTVRPPVFDESDYVWGHITSEGNVDNVFYHEYALRLKNLGLSSAQLRTPGMIRWQSNYVDETWATYVGMAPPGSNIIRYNEAIPIGADFTPRESPKRPSDQSLILALNGANNIPFDREGLKHGGPCEVILVDRHGNDHVVLFHFSDTGTPLERRTNIRLSYLV